MTIQINNIFKSFGNKSILDNVSLDIEHGELVALLGPSGSGKTTLLRIIAGLERPDRGSVYIEGENILERPIGQHNIGFVFQNYALFKHMCIFDNIAFGLRVNARKLNLKTDEIKQRVMELLKLIQLENYYDRYPAELSGGEKQRVALARALAVQPKILLLDEPFGALDQTVRKELRNWLRQLHDQINLTSIFITHDQDEAMEVASRVAIIGYGRLEQYGSPKEVYHSPHSSFVYEFLGNYNEFKGRVDKDGIAHIIEYERPIEEKIRSLLFWPKFRLWRKPKTVILSEENGKIIKIFARPHHIEILKEQGYNKAIPVTLVYINEAGPLVKLQFQRNDNTIIHAEITSEKFEQLNIHIGDQLFVFPREIKFFPKRNLLS